MRLRRADNSDHTMSDFMSHMRAVHFALVVVCAVALGSLYGGTPSEAEVAKRQLQQVLQIKSAWNSWLEEWSHEQIESLRNRETIDGLPAKQWVNVPSSLTTCTPTGNWQFKLMGAPMRFYLVFRNSSSKELADILKREDGQLIVIPSEDKWPNSLEEFRT